MGSLLLLLLLLLLLPQMSAGAFYKVYMLANSCTAHHRLQFANSLNEQRYVSDTTDGKG